jgi:hypothetical protein
MQTRPYVPGKNLWAALTARLTRDFYEGKTSKDYEKIGNFAKDQFRFGYMWPCFAESNPCYFWDCDDFDYLFLDSYASTSLDYSAYSTEEGSLHETEFIAPVARNGNPVYLVGDLWSKKGKIDSLNWKKSMEFLQLGGERTYGWGRLSLCTIWEVDDNLLGKTVAGHKWRDDGKEIILTLGKDDSITAHALAAINTPKSDGPASQRNDDNGALKKATRNVIGPVEPLVGREWKDHAGQKICYAGVYFIPGCKVQRESEFLIDYFGRWTSYENSSS